jgi:hypothetical protein
MGQYYCATTIDKDGNLTVYSLQPTIFRKTRNYDYYNGIKLMEHSWAGNSFTDFFSRLIYNNPLAVSWVGDYSNDAKEQTYEQNPDFRIPSEQYEDFYKAVWGDDSDHVDFELDKRHFNYRGKYLVNHTKKCYFSMSRFAHKSNEWTVYPISLLCAIGNGLGGGDYWSKNTDFDLVGIWALDVISIEDEVPEDYECIIPPKFEEKW